MSNQDNKTYPTHRISFSEKQVDERGENKLGQPVDVATVWPRKHGKQGGVIQWNISPEKLNNGVFFMVDNERQQSRSNKERDGFDQSDRRGGQRDSRLSR